jgi:hypothetical protein
MTPTTESPELTLLDELLQDLASKTASHGHLLQEHLEAARRYLVRDMRVEYVFNLKLAWETIHFVTDEDLRVRLERFIQRAVDPREAMPLEPSDMPA